MFWDIFVSLCTKNGTSPNGVAKKIGVSSGSITTWKQGRMPHNNTILKIANYFDVSVDYLLGKEEKPTENDELSDQQKELIAFARSVPDDKAELVLKLLRAILEDPQ